MKPFVKWTVLPHGRLRRIEDNLLCVSGTMHMPPMGDVERRMTVVRLQDGRLIIYSAIALHEPEMRAIESFGRPAFMIVPSSLHRMDARIWKDRYPSMKVIAPAGARAKVQEVVTVDASAVDFGDASVRFMAVPGTGKQEAALLVETVSGTTLVLSDLIFNLRNRRGIFGWLFAKIGMTGDAPRLPAVIRIREVKDKTALRAQLEIWSHLPNLKRIVISHGDIIVNNTADVLLGVARQLAA